MKRIIYTVFLFVSVVFFNSCGFSSGNSTSEDIIIGEVVDVEKITIEKTNLDIPTLVLIMNWNDYSETDIELWYDKFFANSGSVNAWYKNNTETGVNLVPVREQQGVQDDGIIAVPMNVNHPDYDWSATVKKYNCDIQGKNCTDDAYDNFRRIYINSAIKSTIVDNSIDFSIFDKNGDNIISHTELQIIFIVSGGEAAYGDVQSKSVWAHAFYFEREAPIVDNVTLMDFSTDKLELGSYAIFGATHGIDTISEHKATIGIITHEMGHSLYDLVDLYDIDLQDDSFDGTGSGIGSYGIMSSGTWGRVNSSQYAGSAPSQFSAFSKIEMANNISKYLQKASNISIDCSEKEVIKLKTENINEYFLLECRDTQRSDSDKSFICLPTYDVNACASNGFSDNLLFATIYHVDEDKELNNESATQTASHHYKVRLVEKDMSQLMTNRDGIYAEFADVFTTGDFVDESKIRSYSGDTGYYIDVLSSDYNHRTMTFRITQ